MIRTRNFLLYIVALVFFVSSSGYMVARDIADARHAAAVEQATIDTYIEPADVQVVASDQRIDRAAYIARMKDRIARGEGQIEGAPVVLTSVDAHAASGLGLDGAARTVRWCAQTVSINQLALDWHPADITIRTIEGARLVARVSDEQTLLQLPVRSNVDQSPSCVPYDVIGVGVDGGLIHISDAVRYQSATADTLIGYALDGFPIHGPANNATTLDVCGGTSSPTGYRYHIRTDEPFILGCFAAQPARFVE